MKPDGVATEPMEAEGMQPVAEPTVNEGVSQNGTTSSPPQPNEPQNGKEAPSTGKEAAGKAVDPKSKSKAPVKSKTTAAGPAPGTRPKTTQSRLANRVTKPTASTATNKPTVATNATAEKKPSTAVGAASKKPKVSAFGTSRTATTTATSGTKTGTTVSTANSLSKRPATASTSAATKPKSTAPRPTTAKPSTSAIAKTTSATKTNRTIGSSAPRPATTSATGRVTTSTTTTTASKTNRTATQQPVKPLVTASTTRKDATKTGTTGPAKKPVAALASRPAASKPSNSQKPAAAVKRPLPSIKPPQPKPDDKKSVPTRKVPPSPRNAPSRPTSGKTAAASPSRSTKVTGKLPLSKPTQSVLPLVVKGKSTDKEPAAESVQLSAAVVSTVSVATAAAIATEESLQGPEATPTPESSLDVTASSSLDVQETIDVPVINTNEDTELLPQDGLVDVTASSLDVQETIDVPVLNTNDDTEPLPQDGLVEAVPVEGSDSHPTTFEVTQEFEEQGSEKAGEKLTEKADEKLTAAVAPAAQDAVKQETVTASPFDNPAATTVPSVGSQVAEKAEGVNSECCEDVEEEEREGSQQVSLSEMSGTQPTEESRPGSAGLAGSIWRAGALLSELDSEDVSCSQQGASELSAPGVLEGTESMDDLGDASLKGAEGVSVGSPDFEKVPDNLTNEEDEDDDEDDDDRVCDMDVGSERAEDSNKQHFDHDDDEDEDVEMASEGITESGLESYGNADEDDLTEDYRLDNLNRIRPPPVDMSGFPGAQWNQSSCIADPWAQLPQPASTLLSSPSSEHCQADPETPTQAPAQATLDASNSERGPSYPPNLLEPPSCSTQSPPATSEVDVSPKHVLTPPQACESQFGILTGPGLESDIIRDTSEPENIKDDNSWLGNEISKVDQQPEPLNPVLPDIMQDLGVHFERPNEEEEPETLPADDVLGGPASAPSSPSSATEDEASDTEGEMQIRDPQAELPVTETAPVTHNLSTLEEREEIGGEIEGGGGSDTPQSATSAASYGFDYMTSNSNAQSSAESCSKSPGIFSLENEEQLPDEAKDPSLLKELTLISTPADGEKIESLKGQHVEFQSHSEQHYMLCGESSEQAEPDLLQPVAHLEWGLSDSSSPQHAEEQDLDTQHPYYSTICENTDSPLAGRNSHFPLQPPDLLHIQMTMSSKLRQRPRSAHGTQPPRLPTDLPPRISNVGSNAQLRCLEQHQQHLHKIQQRQEKRNQEQESGEDAREKQVSIEREEEELEKQRRNLLELKLRQQEQELKQQEQELKQRQQIMQWQQELEQQQQKKHKVNTVLLSPSSGLCTIYETVETSDSEEEGQGEVKKKEKAEDERTCPNEEMQRHSEDKDYLYSHSGTPPLKSPQKDHKETDVAPDLPSPPQSPYESPERPVPLEFDWGKKADIVHHLINQTLLLKGDSCSPLLLLPGGAGGTLSPLESSLWPRLLPPLTPTSATVTSVSSFSPEAPGSSAQGEWTVVELETHH
ncbi:platelet binding protein GspB [Triplophysa rosa]|uniref:Mucin-17 n=1 Tax=Triplophysa rosa TaxID=992332 RepID=A0A9W7WZ56_TRIRA|nr:platelet binding protein GspB [Triplophysa rosa]KAI7810751.1 putative mucin-17 [Triplophysa rosa]